jgi:hypothetical protein
MRSSKGKPWSAARRAAYVANPPLGKRGWPKGMPRPAKDREKISAGMVKTRSLKKWKTFSTTESRAKISVAMKGYVPSAEHRDKISDRLTGLVRGPLSEERKKQISAALKGRPAHYPKCRYYYGGAAFRSNWELLAAQEFDRRGIKWEFEAHRFDLGDRTYAPDFYLPEQECFWEIKGFYGPKSKKTISLFREKFPELPLIVATKHVLKAMGISHPTLK